LDVRDLNAPAVNSDFEQPVATRLRVVARRMAVERDRSVVMRTLLQKISGLRSGKRVRLSGLRETEGERDIAQIRCDEQVWMSTCPLS
jgi:hypothetical protein